MTQLRVVVVCLSYFTCNSNNSQTPKVLSQQKIVLYGVFVSSSSGVLPASTFVWICSLKKFEAKGEDEKNSKE
jgi:hypothetical protein